MVFTRQTASETLASRPLFPFHVVAVVPDRHEFASRKFVSIADLVNGGLLIAPKDFTSRMLFDAACKASELRPRFLLESHDQNALVALSEVGYGVAIMPSTIALEHHKVKALPIRSGKRFLGVWTALVFDKQNTSLHVKAFIELAARQLKSDYPGAQLEASGTATSGHYRYRPPRMTRAEEAPSLVKLMVRRPRMPSKYGVRGPPAGNRGLTRTWPVGGRLRQAHCARPPSESRSVRWWADRPAACQPRTFVRRT